MFCSNCGHKNSPGSNFCSSCGAPLSDSESTDTTITFQTSELETDLEDEVHVAPDELEGDRGS